MVHETKFIHCVSLGYLTSYFGKACTLKLTFINTSNGTLKKKTLSFNPVADKNQQIHSYIDQQC